YAIMTWPVDTTFRAAGNLSIQINETQGNDIENQIPYVSDLIDVQAHTGSGTYNEAGYNRSYPVYMRPMASQLIIKADYAGTDAAIKALEAGEDGIDPISLTSVDLLTKIAGTTQFTKKIDLKFTAEDATVTARWDAGEPNNNWSHVTGFNRTSAVQVNKLTTKCVTGTESAKFLILPQKSDIAVATANDGVDEGAIVINTTYGKVVVAAPGVSGSTYTAAEIADAWYRYQAPGAAAVALEIETAIAGTGSDATKVRYTNNIALGLAQVINAFSNNTTTKATSIVKDEPTGAVGTRYVKVLLSKLDMNGLHITSDKQLYDAVRVWKEIGSGDVSVYLDGDATKGEFEISQKTIAKINEINAELAEEATPRSFSVKACDEVGEACETIVITGGGNIPNLAFIASNGGTDADVALNAGETWKWNGTVTVDATSCGVASIINRGTMENPSTATLAIYNNADPAVKVTTIPFENVKDATWTIKTGAVVNVQFDVTNLGTVTIEDGAQYRQDGAGNDFTNEAQTLPKRFLAADAVEKIGVIINSGVFGNVNGGNINNYGRIEHMTAAAKTYITKNQTAGASFAAAFNDQATMGGGADNKMGQINLSWGIRTSISNVSISNALNTGFVSLTVDGEASTLNAGAVGNKVNYIIVQSGVTKIQALAGKYLEVRQEGTELGWDTATATYNLQGLVVFSDVNIPQGVTVTSATATYLDASAYMYVGGALNHASWVSYYGDATATASNNVVTFN
ncbi:MAG: hypothetical protein IJS06_00655, partial [Prevotella sp.]|nr:hypothetical protein [Prevotella sp.]